MGDLPNVGNAVLPAFQFEDQFASPSSPLPLRPIGKAVAERPYDEPHQFNQCCVFDLIGRQSEKCVQWRRLGNHDDAGKGAQQPRHQRRPASREVKGHARRVKGRLTIEGAQRLESRPEERAGGPAAQPAMV